MRKLFIYKLIGLTATVALVELVGLYLGVFGKTGGKVMSTFPAVELPLAFMLQMAGFVAILLTLHVLPIAYAWLSTRAALSVFCVRGLTAESIGLLVLMLTWVAIFLLNNAYVGRSVFAYWGVFTVGPLDELDIARLACAAALLPIPVIIWWLLGTKGARSAIGAAAAISACGLAIAAWPETKLPAENDGQPNIILIGIDSFRPEYVHANTVMPRLSALLAESAVFTEVYTPIARTFPSWTSMLSGLHPLENGARTNLADPDLVKRGTMVTWQLQEAGYHTVLATDERRFSNLDESYGFDTVFGPKAGASDFVLGLVGDFPLVNLLATTDWGGFLFPHLVNNRAVSRLYRPRQFAQRLGHQLASAKADPLFLMTHLCLPHWPYKWATETRMPPQQSVAETTIDAGGTGQALHEDHKLALQNKARLYESSLTEVDRQIAILLDSLQASGHLDNAIVVVLTDHGESIGWPEESLVDVESPIMPLETKQSFGHGTNVLALGQHHTFMAFKRFGGKQYEPGYRVQRFFNYDLKPTLLDLIDLAPKETASSVSMVPWIDQLELDGLDRPLFVETGFNVPAMNTMTINLDTVVAEGSSYYIINDNTRLEISASEMSTVVGNKQRGILLGQLLLAQIPVTDVRSRMRHYEWVLANLESKNAVKLTVENFTRHCTTECTGMLEELLAFYGDELALDQWPAYAQYLQAISVAQK